MRFVSYERDGGIRHGRMGADGTFIVELGDGDLLDLLEGAGLEAGAAGDGPETPFEDVQLRAPLHRPPKLLAVATNYADHVREGGGTPVDPATATPRLFLKPSSAIIGPDTPLTVPTISNAVDWEVELAVVIGNRCRNVTAAAALDVVAGYMTANDVSARVLDFGFERDPAGVSSFIDWLTGKWPDGFAPLGPYLVSASEVPDPQSLKLHLDVNGTIHQDGSTADMLFSVAEIIAFASSFMTLEPGDVIETGTTAGCGAASGTFLQPGDIMTASVGDLGELRTPVVAG